LINEVNSIARGEIRAESARYLAARESHTPPGSATIRLLLTEVLTDPCVVSQMIGLCRADRWLHPEVDKAFSSFCEIWKCGFSAITCV